MRQITLIIFSLLMSIALVSAQAIGVCEELTTAALEITDAVCDDIGRNELCYGFNNVQALDFEYQAVEDFVQTGDIVPINDIASLVTAPFSAEDKTWGIAILSVQANLPDTLPGQNVTIILFGDTEMTSDEALDDSSLRFSAQAISGLNVRSGPGTNYVVVGGLQVNETVTVIGRNEESDWLMVELDNGNSAWVSTPLLNLEGELESLTIRTESTNNPPMQAFHISTGIGSTRCEELLPQDGLLIQAPENTRVNFLINGIEVEIGSTALIRADEETLSISTFAGEVILAAEGVSQIVAIGQQSSVVIGEAPTEPEPYSGDDVRHVPVELLPEHVDIPPPAGQNISIARCSLGEGSVTVNTDSPVIVRIGWATQEMPELMEFMDAATVSLSYDGANQEYWSMVGPTNDPSRGYPFFSNWYWVIENPSIGTHDLTVDFDFSRPITVEGEANVSSYGSVSCELIVEE